MAQSRILQEVHETARGLHAAGVFSELAPEDIRKIRQRAHVSQAVFAACLNTSLSTVQKWEIGKKRPTGIALKLLNLIEQKGLEAVV